MAKHIPRNRPGFTRWPLEIDEDVAQLFDKANEKVFPQGMVPARNKILSALVEKYIEETLPGELQKLLAARSKKK